MDNNNGVRSGFSRRLISAVDYGRIMSLIENDLKNNILPGVLHQIYLTLLNAQIIPWERVPDDLVTMNSRLKVRDLDTQKSRILSITYHENSNNDESIPIYNPLAIACLGKREKSVIRFTDKGRTFSLKVEKILFQPEAQGLIIL